MYLSTGERAQFSVSLALTVQSPINQKGNVEVMFQFLEMTPQSVLLYVSRELLDDMNVQ